MKSGVFRVQTGGRQLIPKNFIYGYISSSKLNIAKIDLSDESWDILQYNYISNS